MMAHHQEIARMYNVERQVRDFLILRGCQTFWVDSAMGIIKQGLASNQYLPQHIIEHQVTVTQQGRVKRYTAKVRVRYPDTATDGIISLRYTCNPDARKAHKLWVGVVEG
jgi:hypothetical protein